MDRLESDVLNHHKHIHGLILWLKSHAGCVLTKDGDYEHIDSESYYIRGDAFDLCNMFSEGSTVAHEIWKRYEGDWSPSKEESPPDSEQQTKHKIKLNVENVPECSCGGEVRSVSRKVRCECGATAVII